MYQYAIVRRPGPDSADGLTSSNLGKPDLVQLALEHQAYIDALRSAGLDIIILKPAAGFPDAYFVEDVAVVTPEIGIITNPGAPSRQGEQASIEPYLAKYRSLRRIEPPGTVDGGDVLIVQERCFVGRSDRTNESGAGQLGEILSDYGYTLETIPVTNGLHLKSSVSFLGQDTLLLTADYADHGAFRRFQKIVVDKDEQYAANALWVNERIFLAAGFRKTYEKLRQSGLDATQLDVREVAKMDGGLTCMSLRL